MCEEDLSENLEKTHAGSGRTRRHRGERPRALGVNPCWDNSAVHRPNMPPRFAILMLLINDNNTSFRSISLCGEVLEVSTVSFV